VLLLIDVQPLASYLSYDNARLADLRPVGFNEQDMGRWCGTAMRAWTGAFNDDKEFEYLLMTGGWELGCASAAIFTHYELAADRQRAHAVSCLNGCWLCWRLHRQCPRSGCTNVEWHVA